MSYNVEASQKLYKLCADFGSRSVPDNGIPLNLVTEGADPNIYFFHRGHLSRDHICSEDRRLRQRYRLIVGQFNMSYNVEASKKLYQLCGDYESNRVPVNMNIPHQLIRDGADPNFCHNGRTPLIIAVGQGNLELVEFLLNHGASVDIPDPYGITPLHYSVLTGYSDDKIIKLLINHEDDVNVEDSEGRPPLVFSLRSASHARILTDNGARVNIIDGDKTLMEHLLIECGLWEVCFMEVAIEILNAGASPYFISHIENRRTKVHLYEHQVLELLRRTDWISFLRKLMYAGFDILSHWRNSDEILGLLRWGLKHLTDMGEHVAQVSQELDEIEALHKGITLPRLGRLCRIRIRHELVFSRATGHIRHKIDVLPLPLLLKTFLKLDEL